MYKSLDSSLRLPCFCFFSRPLIYGFWRNAHDQNTNPMARPLLISLQVVRTSFGFHLRECMGSSSPPPPPAASLQLARTHTRLTHCARASRATRLYTNFARRFARNNYRLLWTELSKKKNSPESIEWEWKFWLRRKLLEGNKGWLFWELI